jgi:hypothetical protein
MAVANTLAYYDMGTTMAVKSFPLQTHWLNQVAQQNSFLIET